MTLTLDFDRCADLLFNGFVSYVAFEYNFVKTTDNCKLWRTEPLGFAADSEAGCYVQIGYVQV